MATIGQVAAMFHLPVSTLRYYDKEGLFPHLERQSGIRQFGEREIETLRIVECLKASGLEIREIRQFMQWTTEGSATYPQRRQLFGCPASAVAYADDYLKIYACGTVFVMLAQRLNPLILTQGCSLTAMGTVLLGAVVNIALDPLLIFTFHMGVAGSSLATMLSQACSCAAVAAFFWTRRSLFRFRRKEMRFRAARVREILSLGVTPFVMTLTECAIQIVFNVNLNRATGGDKDYTAALTVMLSALQLISLPLNGMGNGMQPFVSYLYGKGDAVRLKKGIRCVTVLAFLFCCSIWSASMAAPELYASLFSASETVTEIVRANGPLFLMGSILFFVQMTLQNVNVGLGQAELAPLTEGIRMEHVSFSYEPGREVLHDVSTTFEAGKAYAVVGGSGKSTLLNLLMAAGDYQGSIRLDGTELRDVLPESLYAVMSVIQQNVFVFNASIRDNVTMFRAFPQDALDDAIAHAHLTGLLAERGEAYRCGENGVGLSGGEKQRISIARTLLKKSSVLLADEATAALDAKTAHAVTSDLLDLTGMTRIIVTHNLEASALRRFDRILVMKDGRIEETGTFDELMAGKGYFYALFTVSQ